MFHRLVKSRAGHGRGCRARQQPRAAAARPRPRPPPPARPPPPQAAPKTKQRARNEDDAYDEALEEFDSERAASAAFEGVEVLDDSLLDDGDDADAPWAWDDGAAPGAGATAAAAQASAAGEADADAILAQLAAIDFDLLKDEDEEQRELASMVADALGDDLDLVAAADGGGDVADAGGLSAVRARGGDGGRPGAPANVHA